MSGPEACAITALSGKRKAETRDDDSDRLVVPLSPLAYNLGAAITNARGRMRVLQKFMCGAIILDGAPSNYCSLASHAIRSIDAEKRRANPGPPINVREPVTDLQTVVREIAAEMAARHDRGAVRQLYPRTRARSTRLVRHGGHRRRGESFTPLATPTRPFQFRASPRSFTLTLALGMVGDRLWRRVGREPSGNPSTPSCSWSANAACRAIHSSTPAP